MIFLLSCLKSRSTRKSDRSWFGWHMWWDSSQIEPNSPILILALNISRLRFIRDQTANLELPNMFLSNMRVVYRFSVVSGLKTYAGLIQPHCMKHGKHGSFHQLTIFQRHQHDVNIFPRLQSPPFLRAIMVLSEAQLQRH